MLLKLFQCGFDVWLLFVSIIAYTFEIYQCRKNNILLFFFSLFVYQKMVIYIVDVLVFPILWRQQLRHNILHYNFFDFESIFRKRFVIDVKKMNDV